MDSMSIEEFQRAAHDLVDWMATYRAELASQPVKALVQPGQIAAQLPARANEQGQPFEQIFADFEQVILPGMTHWQHPRFFAYFQANASLPSVLAEMLTATMGAQCMSWVTSPAATELEQRVMAWLADAMGLGGEFTGSIQDAASVSTLVAVLTAREKANGWRSNQDGLFGQPPMVVYCSDEGHSSIDKACRTAGLGQRNLRRIPVDDNQAMQVNELEAAIRKDLEAGLRPLMVVATVGTTATTGVDPVGAIAGVCRRFGLWLHVDAAYAGAALILPEYAALAAEVRQADSVVFNPHKWLFTNFDCSTYFVRDREALIRTFELLPEYLRTSEAEPVVNYRDWSIGLGRRFRALKLWFVMRSFGLEGLRDRLREHITLARALADRIDAHPRFERTTDVRFNLVCFRWLPTHTLQNDQIDAANMVLLEALNASGQLYLSHAKVRGIVTLRLVVGQTDVNAGHLELAWREIEHTAERLGRQPAG